MVIIGSLCASIMPVRSVILVLLTIALLIQGEPNNQRAKRVVSSKPALPHTRPYIVMLTRNDKHICGAALVNRPPNHHADLETGSSDILITAAHCFVDHREKYGDNGAIVYEEGYQFLSDPKLFKALFGKHNSSSYEDSQFEIQLVNVIVHPEYYRSSYGVYNDIAMVKLERPVNFSSITKPIALGHSELADVTNCSVAGWGRRTGIPAHLDHNAVLSVLDLSNMDIESVYYKMKIHDWNETTVNGDSGSPMTCWHNNRLALHGVVSHAQALEWKKDYGVHNITFPINEWVKFSSIKYFSDSQWITNAFRNIDKPSMWYNILKEQSYEVLSDVEQIFHLRTTEELVNAFYIGLPNGYNFELDFPQRSDQEYFDLWFGEKIYNKISNAVDRIQVDLSNVIGYTKQRDAYRCTIECFMRNRNRPCIFVYDTKRCYFTSQVESAGVRQVYVRALLITMKASEKVAELNTVRSKIFWNVSIAVEGQTHYHCDGKLVANGGNMYNKVKITKRCLLELRGTHQRPELTLTAMIDGAIHTSTLNFTRGDDSLNSEIVVLEIQSQIPVPNMPFDHSDVLSEYLTLRKYNPYSGAMLTEPGARPFIARIMGYQYWRTRKQCYGVLVNESSFMSIQGKHIDATRYILTTKSCIEIFSQYDDYDDYADEAFIVKIGEHHMGIESLYYQFSLIKAKHFNNVTLFDNFVLLELETPIKFNQFTKPALLTKAEISLLNKTIFALSYDSGCNFNWRKPMQEIPMKLSMLSYDTEIIAERQYYVPNEHSCHSKDGYLGEPLFAYDSNDDTYHLLGLSSGFVSRDNGFVDGYKSVQGYVPWIAGIINRNSVNSDI